MAYITGKNVVLSVLKDGLYSPFLCATDCAITINTEIKDVRTINDGYWKKKRGQSLSYGISLTGLIELQELQPVAFYLITNYQTQLLAVPYQMVFTDPVTALVKYITGNALIVSSSLTGVPVGFSTSSFEMTGDGAPVITDSTTVCNAVIGNLEIGPGDPDSGIQARVAYDGVAGAARIEYSIDGGDRIPIISPAESGFINLSGLAEGSHTVQVWVVCENGIDGETNSVTFPIDSGGEPGPTCAFPGVPEMSEITAATATATWTAASPAPAGGYFWELRFVATDNLAASANTFDLATNLSGLIDTAEYYFRVKSLCEEGVSESSYQRTDFTAEGPTCARSGPLSITYNTGGEVTVVWSASPSAPMDGYYLELIDSLGNVTPLGYTPDLFGGAEGLIDGDTYTINVYAVCSSADNDLSLAQSIAFVSGGAPVCNVPGTPSMSPVASTTATATWSAASPAPADGYAWQLLAGITVIDSGTTGSTFVNLTGLTASTDYTFQVKSLCDTGVSESGYMSVDFATDAASCANPGPVLVSTVGLDPGDATASWDAASPAPTDGYEWNVIRNSDSVLIDSGATAGLSVNLTGLSTGVSYQFQVRSVCVTGSSYSGYRTRNFTST